MVCAFRSWLVLRFWIGRIFDQINFLTNLIAIETKGRTADSQLFRVALLRDALSEWTHGFCYGLLPIGFSLRTNRFDRAMKIRVLELAEKLKVGTDE